MELVGDLILDRQLALSRHVVRRGPDEIIRRGAVDKNLQRQWVTRSLQRAQPYIVTVATAMHMTRMAQNMLSNGSNNFVEWLKTFGPAQNILRRVKGQGIRIKVIKKLGKSVAMGEKSIRHPTTF